MLAAGLDHRVTRRFGISQNRRILIERGLKRLDRVGEQRPGIGAKAVRLVAQATVEPARD
jgi:hypothetical protein